MQLRSILRRIGRVGKSLVPPILTDLGRTLLQPIRKPAPPWSRIQQGPLQGAWVYARPTRASPTETSVGSAISALVRSGWICFDVGAHFGNYTLLMARLAGAAGQVHAFEPVPFNLTILQENVRRNGIAHIVRIHPFALANATGTARFRASNAPRESGQGFLVGLDPPDLTWAQRRFPEFPVEQRRLDDLRRELSIPPPQLIKIDVEGAEVDVLRGAFDTIRAVRPALIVELHTEFNAALCATILAELGYVLNVRQSPRETRPQIIALPPGSSAAEPP